MLFWDVVTTLVGAVCSSCSSGGVFSSTCVLRLGLVAWCVRPGHVPWWSWRLGIVSVLVVRGSWSKSSRAD